MSDKEIIGEKIYEFERLNYTFSLITQGQFKFYSLTIPSNILAETCFVTSRFDDKEEGFQRRLDEKKAIEIANYIDAGIATIPSAVILSAQPEAELVIKKGGRALTFSKHPKAFLVIDGQHRIWGYSKAKSNLRVPVIVYQGLTRKQETRLFIDINTKQKPVPNELLLDIKYLADMENNEEVLLRDLFNLFNEDKHSVLRGLLSPSEKAKGKITRTTFNSAFNNIINILQNAEVDELYPIFNSYLSAFKRYLSSIDANDSLTSPIVFRAIIAFFPDTATRVKDRFNSNYQTDNFVEILEPLSPKINKALINKSSKSYKPLLDSFKKALSNSFTF